MALTFRTRIGILSHLPGMHYLEIPKKVIQNLGGTFKMRLWCQAFGKVSTSLSFQCGLMALGNGKGYISITQKRLKQLGVKAGDRIKIELKPDTSRYGMNLSSELQEVLKQDKEGRRRFEILTPGKQRYIIHYINTVRNPDLRVDRAVRLIENLKKTPEGKEVFRDILGKNK